MKYIQSCSSCNLRVFLPPIGCIPATSGVRIEQGCSFGKFQVQIVEGGWCPDLEEAGAFAPPVWVFSLPDSLARQDRRTGRKVGVVAVMDQVYLVISPAPWW